MIQTREIKLKCNHLKERIEKDYWRTLFALNKVSLYGIYYYYPIWLERNRDLIVQFEDVQLNEIFVSLLRNGISVKLGVSYLGISEYLNEISDLIACLGDYTKMCFNPKLMYSIRSTITDKYCLLIEIKGIGNVWIHDKNTFIWVRICNR